MSSQLRDRRMEPYPDGPPAPTRSTPDVAPAVRAHVPSHRVETRMKDRVKKS